MWVFNRIVMVLVFAALFVGGLFAAIYGLNILGYQIADLQQALGLPAAYEGFQSFITGVENGSLTPAGIAILIGVALLGLILLILELKPRRPRRVRMEKGTYVTRGAVGDEVAKATEGTRNILGSSVKVKAKRGPGAVVDVNADVRRGEDQKVIKGDLQTAVQERLAASGIPVGKVKVRLNESDPRQTKTRVQ
ncbi:MAG: hypothetical protein H0U65_08095 [Rubrobacter sp.]|nr:hypothetical protein [Rubrobacter sp.]